MPKSEDDKKCGACRDPDADGMARAMAEWLAAWRRGQFGREPRTRRAGGEEDRPAWGRSLLAWAEFLVLKEWTEEDGRAGGRLAKAKKRAAESLVFPVAANGDLNPLEDIGHEVDEFVQDQLQKGLAKGTARTYQLGWDRWCWWTHCQGWESPYLLGESKMERIKDENQLLTFAGYLAWSGLAPGTIRQTLFALQSAHKRAGAGDPLAEATRIWILLEALQRERPPAPRKLGVTAEMLAWMTAALGQPDAAEKLGVPELRLSENRLIMEGALKVGFFFLCRASEYVKSGTPDYEKILRGMDVRIREDGSGKRRVDVQFRKTKTDQLAFGCTRTHYQVDAGARHLCVVDVISRLLQEFPERADQRENGLPLFRWRSGGLVRREDLQRALERAAEAVGLPAARFRSHSLRIGGASALLHATGQFDLVKRFGRWSSDAVHVYLHDSAEQYEGLAEKMANDRSAVHYT